MYVDHRKQDEFLELLRQDKVPLGKGLGIHLDNHLRFKNGNFNIILGHSNVGKTYWVLWYLLAHSVKHGHNNLIYSSENTVHGIKRNLIELYTGRKIKGMPAKDLEAAKKFIEAHFDFIDTNRAWTIEEFMKEVQQKKHYDVLMIDPHNSFLRPKGSNAHDYDYEMATKLRLFCKVMKTTVYLCIHASTDALRKVHNEGDFKGHPIPPNMSDAEGGGKWGNRADDFIVIHRYIADQNNWMYTHVHVKKVKETESGGLPTLMHDPVRFKLQNGTQFLCNETNAIK